MAQGIEYRKLFNLQPVLLFKSDLVSLQKLLLEEPATDIIEIRVSDDSTTVSGGSIEELLDNPRTPASTQSMEMNMRRWAETEDTKGFTQTVNLTLNHSYIQCQVYSHNETWFLGKKSQIEAFFGARKPWYALLNRLAVLYPSIAILLTFYAVLLMGDGQYGKATLPIVVSTLLVLAAVMVFKQKLFPFVEIRLREDAKKRIGINEWTVLITGLSLVVTVAQIVISLFSQ